MKHITAKLLLAALLAGVSAAAGAANPFSDVKSTDWSYQAVTKLAQEGVVTGYPDGTFQGEKPITRYEMAKITAGLMAREKELSAAQQETVKKLSGEYAGELQNLGVRVSELEKKASNTQVILDLRFQYLPVYSNVFTGEKEDRYGARLRVNTITNVTDNVYLYSQFQTLMGLGGKEYKEAQYYDNGHGTTDGSKEDEVTLKRLFTTYHFGGGDGNNKGLGPSKDIVAIGRFPVKMGVTGYTYDDTFTGAMVQFGDSYKGGKFTLAYGRAAGINYNYTSPMMKGISNFKQDIAADSIGKNFPSYLKPEQLAGLHQMGITDQQIAGIGQVVGSAIAGTTNFGNLEQNIKDKLTETFKGQLGEVNAANLAGTMSSALMDRAGKLLGEVNPMLDWESGTLYPMMPQGVKMRDGEDMDVPVAYMSYIYRNPSKYEFHLYGMEALGPVGEIAKAYGTALSYDITDKWNVHGEFVKNLRKLPLNNERPHSFNYGVTYGGGADVLKENSYGITLDYVYSQAGTYFGGSGNDIADQYMAHVYDNWHGRKMPAYIGDKVDGMLAGQDGGNYGGAKFFLAKAQYVPVKGLILEANYGFKAKDMGGRKMDDMFQIMATMYYK